MKLSEISIRDYIIEAISKGNKSWISSLTPDIKLDDFQSWLETNHFGFVNRGGLNKNYENEIIKGYEDTGTRCYGCESYRGWRCYYVYRGTGDIVVEFSFDERTDELESMDFILCDFKGAFQLPSHLLPVQWNWNKNLRQKLEFCIDCTKKYLEGKDITSELDKAWKLSD